MAPVTPKRDLLSVEDIRMELPTLLRRAELFKKSRSRNANLSILRGATVALIFEKPSTRTRVSFDVAVSELGGRPVYLSSKDLQLGRGETIADTARVLSRYVHIIVYRAHHHTDEIELARWSQVPVINALDDREHPCQIVADLLTMYERWKGRFRGHRLAYIGDGNNVLNSLLLGSAIVGLDLVAAVPVGYRPPPDLVGRAEEIAKETGSVLTFTERPEEAAEGADALYTDVWISMGEEAQSAEREKTFQGFQINQALLKRAHSNAFVLHDLPAHRGQEITDEVMDGPRAAIWDEAENRLHAQKAILELLVAPPRRRTVRRRFRRS